MEGDKVKLTKFLDTLGFSSRLRESLDEAEKQYRDDSSPFELKSCFAHLRSFLEVMHRESAMSVASAAGETVVDKWGSALAYLRQKANLLRNSMKHLFRRSTRSSVTLAFILWQLIKSTLGSSGMW